FCALAESDGGRGLEGGEKPPAAGHRDPTATRHVEGTTRLQRAPGKLCLEIRGRELPILGKSMKNQILEQHERHPARKKRGLYVAAARMHGIVRAAASSGS